MSTAYRILLYYKFVHFDDVETFVADHLNFSKALGVRGRVLLAPEGINGTVSGTVAQTDAYMASLRQDPRLQDLWFKIDEHEGHAFKKMFVRARNEIVTFRTSSTPDPSIKTGHYLKPTEFRELLDQEDVIILDGRNDYEFDVGHFRNAIRPEVASFREFPEWIRENLADQKDKKILTYCTGGIRCEKLTAFMLEEGFSDVNQLEGGIIHYSQDNEVQGEGFNGQCYVFDERITVPVNRKKHVIVAKCYHCRQPEERYLNCANPECNLQHICCASCEIEQAHSCSDACRKHPRNRYVREGVLP